MLSSNVAASQYRRNDVKFLSLFCSVAVLFFFFNAISCKSLQTALWVEFCISELKNTLKGTMYVIFIPPAHRGFVTHFQLPGLELHSLLHSQRRSKQEPVYCCLPGVWWEGAGKSVSAFSRTNLFRLRLQMHLSSRLACLLMELKAYSAATTVFNNCHFHFDFHPLIFCGNRFGVWFCPF